MLVVEVVVVLENPNLTDELRLFSLLRINSQIKIPGFETLANKINSQIKLRMFTDEFRQIVGQLRLGN